MHVGFEVLTALVSCSAYFSTLKMEAICSSETSADFKQTTCRYIPDDSTLSNIIHVTVLSLLKG
jgi:hypothetical protein